MDSRLLDWRLRMSEFVSSTQVEDEVSEAESATTQTRQSDPETPASTSCLYVGSIHHRRYTPAVHQFRHSLFLASIDLDDVDSLFRYPLLFSTSRFSIVQFRRSDYHGDSAHSLSDCIRELIYERTGETLTGPIRLLTHLRYFGFAFNPVSLYYCYESDGETLATIVAEVTNTPWGEQHCYVIPVDTENDNKIRAVECQKEFHVSQFMEIAMRYRWRISKPAENLTLGIENYDGTERVFDATLQLVRRELTPIQMTWMLIRYPLMAWKVIAAIYWHAIRLWWKRVPFVPHP